MSKKLLTVWHTGLKYKICNNFNLPQLTQKLLCNFLDGRVTRIKHQTTFSPTFNPQAGVPQGSVLSPTLFNMYTADLPPPTHNDSLTIQYADDVTQLARATTIDFLTNKIQTELTATSLWEQNWRIKAHPEKSKVTYIERRRRREPRRIFLNNTIENPIPIPVSKTNKVLGLTIDNQLRFHIHITQKAAMASTALSNLERFRGSSQKTKLHLYKAFILPLLTYCPLALSLAAPSNVLKLQRIQNRALRFATGTRWYDFRTSLSLHEETNIAPINYTHYLRIDKQLTLYQDRHPHMYDHINTILRRRNQDRLNFLDPPTVPPIPIFR